MTLVLSRQCSKCKVEKLLTCFVRHNRGKYGRYSRCSDCTRAEHAQRRAKFRKLLNRRENERNLKIRERVFEILGDTCKRCGFKDKRALQIDHVNGDGAKQRREIGKRSSYGLYRLILKEKQFENYQILCANCNWIKRVEEGSQNGY